MVAILGGLGAALMFSVGTVCSSRSSRLIGAWSAVAWVMISGLLLNLVLVAFAGSPGPLDPGTLGWMFVAGAGNVVGLMCAYTALRHGKVGLVTPIVSTEGAVAAVAAVLLGEALGVASAVLLVVIVTGVVLASVAPSGVPVEGERKTYAVLLAATSAVLFGSSLYATGRLSGVLPMAWVLLPPRLLGVLFLALPLGLTGHLSLSRRALPLVVVAGVCEVVGFASYTWGARQGIAVTAVLVSQVGAISGLAAYVLFHERLTRLQLGGVAVILVGVAALSAVRA